MPSKQNTGRDCTGKNKSTVHANQHAGATGKVGGRADGASRGVDACKIQAWRFSQDLLLILRKRCSNNNKSSFKSLPCRRSASWQSCNICEACKAGTATETQTQRKEVCVVDSDEGQAWKPGSQWEECPMLSHMSRPEGLHTFVLRAGVGAKRLTVTWPQNPSGGTKCGNVSPLIRYSGIFFTTAGVDQSTSISPPPPHTYTHAHAHTSCLPHPSFSLY